MMCKAFSGIATRKKVYWKLGLDSHNALAEHYKLKDDDTSVFVPIEITPNNGNYIDPDNWVFKFDDVCPEWWKQSHEQMCWSAKDEWYKQLSKKLYKSRIRNLIRPFELPMVKQVTKTDINNLRKWSFVRDSVGYSIGGSVWDSVRDSVWDSVRDSVGYSIGGSVWDSVRDSVWDSVRDSVGYSIGGSVWAYYGYLFRLRREDWKHTKNINTKSYPFMPLVKLWKRGLVPSYDGVFWRLHSGKEAKVVFKIRREELR